jgi:hypothetical protein
MTDDYALLLIEEIRQLRQAIADLTAQKRRLLDATGTPPEHRDLARHAMTRSEARTLLEYCMHRPETADGAMAILARQALTKLDTIAQGDHDLSPL